MSEDPDNALRRSKRNKFHLDVAAIHHGRSRSPALQHLTVVQAASSPNLTRISPSVTPAIAQVSEVVIVPNLPIKQEETVVLDLEESESSPVEESVMENQKRSLVVGGLGKRKRKAPVYNDFSYSLDSDYDSDVTPAGVECTDPSGIRLQYSDEFPCPRCPAQFESRVGLTNHLKLHGANKTFPCHNCDFSCTNRKTMRQHKKVHGQHTPTRKRKSIDHKKSSFSSDGMLKNNGKKPKRSFPCPWCPFKTHTFARLIPHKLGHFRSCGFQCSLCSFRASSRDFLLNHISIHGPKSMDLPKSSEISYVSTMDPDVEPLKINFIKFNFPPEKPVLFCKKCGFKTRQQNRFERHQKKHRKSRNSSLRRRRTDKVGSHIQTILDDVNKDKRFVSPRKFCNHCGRKFGTIGQYLVHVTLKHYPNRRSQRPNCVEMVQERLGRPEFLNRLRTENKDPSDLIRHVAALGPQSMIGELVAGGIGAFSCQLCPYKATTQAKLSTHENKHKIKAELQCSQCTYSCKTPRSLTKHNELHGNIKVKEEIDGTVFPNKEDGERLSRTSSPAKKMEASLRCPHCPYRSKHGCDMKAHQKMHSDRGTFRCPYCTYSTMRLNALKTHTALHEQEMGHIAADSTAPTPDQPMVQKLPEKDKESDFLPKEIIIKKIWNDVRENVLGKKIMKSNGSMVYRCAHCPFEAGYPSTLNQHSKHHLKSAKYKCPKCSFSTDRDDILPKHIDSHQNEPAPEGGWFCSACPYRADSYGKQWHHVQKHKKVGRFNCEICKFGVGSIQSFTDHMALHGIVAGNVVPNTVLETNKQASVESCSATTTDISSTVTGPRTPEGSSSSEKDKSEERSTTSSVPGIALAQDFEMDMDWSGASPIPQGNRNNTASPASGPITRNKKLSPLKRQLLTRSPVTSSGPYKNNIQIYLPPIPAAIRPKRKRQISTSSSGNSNEIDDDEKIHECKQCPFTCLDSKMLKFHTRMHEGDRPQKCAMCSFNCFNIDALYSHMNVHAPQLPESMLATMRKKLAQRRRNGSLHERETLPANATNVFKCQQCAFRTAFQDRFLQHRMEHVQHFQQRLMTQMKRAANDDKDGRKSKILARKKIERKWNYCTQCSFRSDTIVALMNHQEFHGNRNNVFTCRYCNYSANTRDVVTYHENTHHMDLPATNQTLNLVAVNGIVETDLLSEKRQKYSCSKCSFVCHELADFIEHFESRHVGDPQLQEVVEKLRMGLLPTIPLRSSQSCQVALAQEQKSPTVVAAEL